MTYRAGIATRQRIIDATRSLLAEKGLDGTTIKGICTRAEILPGSFYNLFPSKEEVVLTVIKEAIEAVDPDGSGTETVSDLVAAFVRFVTTEPVIARVYFITAVAGGLTDSSLGRRVLRHHQARVDRFEAALRRAGAGPEAGATAETMVAALTGHALRALLDQDFDLPRHARRLLEL
jgi:AcrR family transcriptional regulator